MFRRLFVGTTFAFVLAGCVAMDNPNRTVVSISTTEKFAHRSATSEVVLLWNCEQPTAGTAQMTGVVQSPWQSQPIRGLEFTLEGVDAKGRTTAQTSWDPKELLLFTNQQVPFQLDLKTTGSEARLDLYFQYFFEGEFDSSARLAGSPVPIPHLFAQTKANLIRDACSDSQHRGN